MIKFIRENILKNKKGANEIIAFVLILLFIILVVVNPVKNLGNTTKEGVSGLNTQLQDALE